MRIMKINSTIVLVLIVITLINPYIKAGGILSKTKQNPMEQLLDLAITTKNEKVFNILISQDPTYINTKFNNNKFLLHILIEKHVESKDCTDNCFHIKAFRDLIIKKADVNATATFRFSFSLFEWYDSLFEWYDITPLHLSAKYCLTDFVQILLDNEAEVHAQTFTPISNGQILLFSPLDIAKREAKPCGSLKETIHLLQEYEKCHPGKPVYNKTYNDICVPNIGNST